MTSSLTGELGKLGGPLGQIGNIGQKAAGLIKTGMGTSSSAVAGLGLGLVAVGGLAAAFAVKSDGAFTDVGKEVIKLQRYTGGTAEEMSKLRYAAQQSGVGTDLLAKSMLGLSKNIVSGKSDFDKWGIATVDATGKTLPLDKVLYNVADKFKNGVIPQAEKAGVAAKLFGKAGADLVPMLNKGSEGLRALGEEAQKYGLVLTGSNIAAVKAATAAHREQTAAMQGLQVQIGSQVLPVMTQLTKSITTGLLVVMPAVSAVVRDGVVPVFSLLSTVVGGASHVLSEHAGLVKIAGIAIGSVMVPALAAWAVAQGVVIAQAAPAFLLGLASTAVRAATSIGLLSGSMEAGSVAVTGFGIAAAGATLGIGLVIARIVTDLQHSQAEAKKMGQAIVDGASSPQDAITQLTSKQGQLRAEIEKASKAQSFWSKQWGDETSARLEKAHAQLDDINKRLKDQQSLMATAGDASTQASNAIEQSFTRSGQVIASLGGAIKLTDDQVQELADSMKIDLTKGAVPGVIEALTAQAQRLSVTSVAVLKLSDDHKILSDWTQDVTKRTAAFTDALDVLIGGAVGAEKADIAYQKSIVALTESFKANGRQLDIHTEKGQANEEAIIGQIEATTNQIKANLANGQTMEQQKPIIDSHIADLRRIMTQAGFTTAQIQALLTQYHLTPDALAQVSPAIDGQTSAWGGLSSAISGTIVTFQQAVAEFRKDTGVITSTAGSLAAAGKTTGVNVNQSAAGNVSGSTKIPVKGARAAGGPVEAGVPYLVGEDGPEIRTFDKPGMILPHGVFTGGASPVTYVIHHHHYDDHSSVVIEGSVIRETELFEKSRMHANKYNQRAGSGR